MLIQTNQLNQAQIISLNGLVKACEKTDGNKLPVYQHLLMQNRQRSSSFLLYKNQYLIGFISAYFFYDDGCEIALLVDPAHRRQKIATQLLSGLMPLLRTTDIRTLHFSTIKENSSWLSSFSFIYEESEYEMIRQKSEKIIIAHPRLLIKRATINDIPFLCAVDEACFKNHDEDMVERLKMLINDRHYRLIIANLDDHSIGKAHIHRQAQGTQLSDIAVLPHYQKQGFGYEIIANCINYALDTKNINLYLTVQTENSHAINLYSRLNFNPINTYDYWRIKTEILLKKLLNH